MSSHHCAHAAHPFPIPGRPCPLHGGGTLDRVALAPRRRCSLRRHSGWRLFARESLTKFKKSIRTRLRITRPRDARDKGIAPRDPARYEIPLDAHRRDFARQPECYPSARIFRPGWDLFRLRRGSSRTTILGDPHRAKPTTTTRRLAEAAQLLQISLLDHVIIGSPIGGNLFALQGSRYFMKIHPPPPSSVLRRNRRR